MQKSKKNVLQISKSHDNLNNKLKIKCKVCGIFLRKKHQFDKKAEYYCIGHQNQALEFLIVSGLERGDIECIDQAFYFDR